FPLQDETYKIIGLCMEVHNNLGKGFSEIVYKDALEIEFRDAGIFYEREKEFTVNYKGIVLPHRFLCRLRSFWKYYSRGKKCSEYYRRTYCSNIELSKSITKQSCIARQF